MMWDVRSFRELDLYVSRRAGLAVKRAATVISEQLRDIMQDDYSENMEKLLLSVVYDMLDGNTASIGIQKEIRNNRLSERRGLHNTVSDNIGDARFGGDKAVWSEYQNWCNENVPNVLKSELQKMGLAVKRF